MKNLILALLLLAPLSAFANGNCSYVAYNECYAYPHVPFTRSGAIFLCLSSGKRLPDGMITTSSFGECKKAAREFGQFVTVHYDDFDPKKKEKHGEAFRDFP